MSISMSNDKLPVPYNPSGYSLEKDEEGHALIDHSQQPPQWQIIVQKDFAKRVMFAETFTLKTIFNFGENGANQILDAAKQTPVSIYSGTHETCETKLGQISEGLKELKKIGHLPDGIKISIVSLG